uniref:P-type phospholipid transporter n=1 Tax=Enterobius vermicularis TaxID=51028 RepID=A0A0N4UTY0_ENTVE
LQIVVGDIVKVEEGKFFPADLLLLSSSEPSGLCYIETSNIDGETHLKFRHGLKKTSHVTEVSGLQSFSCEIRCEPPNKKINQFHGLLIVGKEEYPLGIEHTLLRGARLKHTRWIHGVVLYAGHETKLLINSKAVPIKLYVEKGLCKVSGERGRTFIEFEIWFLQINFATSKRISILKLTYAQAFCGAKFILMQTWLHSHRTVVLSNRNENSVFYTVITFFILYNNLLPISLLATLEVIRFVQAWYINNDLELYDHCSDTRAAARTSNLMEELG